MDRELKTRIVIGVILVTELFLGGLVSGAYSFASNDAASGKNKQRKPDPAYPSDYFKMPDSKAAAKQLLADAVARGINIDIVAKGATFPVNVPLPSGAIMAPDNGESLLDRIKKKEIKSDLDSTDIVVVFQLTRQISYRELAEIMSICRIYDTLYGSSYIGRIPIEQVQQLIDLPTVGWVDQYVPEYKYPPSLKNAEPRLYHIVSLIGLSDQCERDLRELGVEVRFRIGSWYSCFLSGADIPRLARLWWVKKFLIDPGMPRTDGGLDSGKLPDPSVQSLPAVKFQALDSRKLVSASTRYLPETGNDHGFVAVGEWGTILTRNAH